MEASVFFTGREFFGSKYPVGMYLMPTKAVFQMAR